MTIDEMRRRKQEKGYSYAMIAQMSGVPLGTVQKVLGGITKAPRRDTILALERALSDSAQPGEGGARPHGGTSDTLLRESGAAYRIEAEEPQKRQGSYTLEDYYALPDDVRMELIDGRLYEMEAPTTFHQALGDEIRMQFSMHIKAKKGLCMTLTSPLDVQLDRDNRTMLQPDVVIVCDREKFKRGIVYGAPDLVAEVLSKSTQNRDLIIKLNKYYAAGVREYWIVDPGEKKIRVYLFSGEEPFQYHEYDRDSVVPVGIFGGECTVDFKAIFDYTDFLEDTEG